MFQTPALTVDLSAVTANWQLLRDRFHGRETAAVVKADAYGLGMVPVAQALEKAGCHTFFVATLDEALELRDALPDVRILVFHGVAQGEEFAFANHRIIPVLNSREQLARWKPIAAEHVHAVSALHVDTGMGRLGLEPEDFFALMETDAALIEHCRVSLLMSHLACAPELAHPHNAAQHTLFAKIRAHLPQIPASLCNSAGIFHDKAHHYDLARPGCSLYGIAPLDSDSLRSPQGELLAAGVTEAKGGQAPLQIKHTATWRAPILQIRTLEKDQTIGYGATATAKKGARIATVASGYADGYHRILSNHSCAYLGDTKVPLIGRVTMDMLCFDVSNVPEAILQNTTHLTLLGDQDGIRVDALAARAQTIGYEILTSIGARVKRIYV